MAKNRLDKKAMPKAAETEAEPKTLAEAMDALPIRQRRLLDLLPKHDWQVKPAAIEAQYAPSYAQRLATLLKGNVNFCQAVEAKRREFMEATGWDEAKWQEEVIEQYQEAKVAQDRTAVCQLLKMLGQNIGVFEQDNRQRGGSGPRIIVNLPPAQEQTRKVDSVVCEALPASDNTQETDGSGES